MRILHISEPHSEGVFTVLRHLVEQQNRRGHEVHVLSPPATPRLPGVTHHDWDIVRGNPGTYLRAVRQVRRLSRTLGPDVVHLHSFVAGVLGRVTRGVPAGVPRVYQPHAWSTGVFILPMLNHLVELLERRGARRTDVLVCNCQDELDRGAQFGVRVEGRVVGVPVDLTRHQQSSDPVERARRRDAMGLEGERVVLLLGRLTHQKGQDALVPVWEMQPPAGSVLAIVGPGDPEPLARLSPTQWGRTIRAFGKSDDVREWLQAADLLVLPSRYETVGLAVAEAMASGLPVVATDVDGVRETLVDGVLPAAGAVVAVEDLEGLLDAVRARLDDSGLWSQESVAARARAETLFPPEGVAEEVESAYRRAIDVHTREEITR